MFRSAAAAGPEGSVLASFRAAGSGGSAEAAHSGAAPGPAAARTHWRGAGASGYRCQIKARRARHGARLQQHRRSSDPLAHAQPQRHVWRAAWRECGVVPPPAGPGEGDPRRRTAGIARALLRGGRVRHGPAPARRSPQPPSHGTAVSAPTRCLSSATTHAPPASGPLPLANHLRPPVSSSASP